MIEKLPAPALLIALACTATAAVSTIPATGWSHDMVINGAGPFNLSVTGTMDGGLDQFQNWTWVEAGTYTDSTGNTVTIPGFVAGTHDSLTGNGSFTFQPFDQNNVLGLDGGQSRTLTLVTPTSFSSLALYGASGFGGKTATITLTFTDNSTTVVNVASGQGIGTDWFNTGSDIAFQAGARASNKSEEGYTYLFIGQDPRISINESFFTLSAQDEAKLLQSVTVQNTGGNRMAVFALSGQSVPEPSVALLGGLGLLGLLRRRRN